MRSEGEFVCKTYYDVEPLNPKCGDDWPFWWETPLAEKLPCAFVSKINPYIDFVDRNLIDTHLTPLIQMWVLGEDRQYGRIGESDQSFRNQCMFGFLMRLSGLNSYTHPNEGSNRNNVTLNYNNIPLVSIEVDEGESICQLEWRNTHPATDLLQKHKYWLPHWAKIPFIFGFAITTSELSVYCLKKPIDANSNHYNHAIIRHANISDPESRLKCLKYILNIARVIKYFITSGAVTGASSIPFDIWVDRKSKSVRLSRQFVENRFRDEEKYQQMKLFYSEMKRLKMPNVEQFYDEDPFTDEDRIIRLQPLGIERGPTTIDELRCALKHVLRFLQHFHAVGYMHCDLRWPNIVNVNGDGDQNHSQWVVIDCTEYLRIDDEPAKLLAKSGHINDRYVFDPSKPWSPRYDYYQFGKLLVNTMIATTAYDEAGTDLRALAARLTDKEVADVDIDEVDAIIYGWKTEITSGVDTTGNGVRAEEVAGEDKVEEVAGVDIGEDKVEELAGVDIGEDKVEEVAVVGVNEARVKELASLRWVSATIGWRK